MLFKEIIGQNETKEHLISEAKEGRIPHALLFYGSEGIGKLNLALAYAQYISCENPQENDSCGVCPNCIKYNKLIHPDLHFVYPVVKKKSSNKTPTSDTFINEWRSIFTREKYFTFHDWLKEMGAENQQAIIYSLESDEILKKLSLKSSTGEYKIMIIWLPEKMNIDCSNKILKILEEPPQKTVFILVSEQPDSILPTILSRTQRMYIPTLKDEDIYTFIQQKFGLLSNDAKEIAHLSQGNIFNAINAIQTNKEHKYFFELFVSLMRLSYQRKIKEMKIWSEEVAGLGRERQKEFLAYCQKMIRENFIFNFKRVDLNYLNTEERNFSSRFAPFINENNVIRIMNELNEAQQHIEQNVNAKMVFFDFSLKMIVLLLQK